MLLRMIFTVLLVGFSQQAALAQYPTKPVHIVVPYPPGGAVDAFARVCRSSCRMSGASRSWSTIARVPAR